MCDVLLCLPVWECALKCLCFVVYAECALGLSTVLGMWHSVFSLCVCKVCVLYKYQGVTGIRGVMCAILCVWSKCVELCFVFWLFVLYACLLYLFRACVILGMCLVV